MSVKQAREKSRKEQLEAVEMMEGVRDAVKDIHKRISVCVREMKKGSTFHSPKHCAAIHEFASALNDVMQVASDQGYEPGVRWGKKEDFDESRYETKGESNDN